MFLAPMHFKTSAGATNSRYSRDLHLLCVPRLLSTVSFCLVLKLLLLLGVLLPVFTSIPPRNADLAAVRGHFTGLSLALAALLLLPNDCVFRASPVLPAGLNGSLAIPSSSRDTCRSCAPSVRGPRLHGAPARSVGSPERLAVKLCEAEQMLECELCA